MNRAFWDWSTIAFFVALLILTGASFASAVHSRNAASVEFCK